MEKIDNKGGKQAHLKVGKFLVPKLMGQFLGNFLTAKPSDTQNTEQFGLTLEISLQEIQTEWLTI